MDHTQKSGKLKGAQKLAVYLLVIGVICVLVAGIFGFRIFRRIEHRSFPIPRQTEVNLQDWMTVPYISRTYGVPGPVMFEKLNLDPQKYNRSNLTQIAEDTEIELPKLLVSIKAIISDFQSSHPNPPPKQ